MKQFLILFLLVNIIIFNSGCSSIKYFVDPQPLVNLQYRDYLNPESVVKGQIKTYFLSENEIDNDPNSVLLRQQAPVIVQGVLEPSEGAYEKEADFIGSPEIFIDSLDSYRVRIDTSSPSIFGRVEKAMVKGHELTQLVYAYWYPRHPVGGIQKGEIDGGVLRVTLDAQSHPSIYEHSQICGCYHGVFVSDRVERWAREEFGQIERKQNYYSEKKVKGGISWKIRDVIPGMKAQSKPVLFLEAGTHHCVAIQTTESLNFWKSSEEAGYTLKSYGKLETLPVSNHPGRFGSMFNEEGLVWGARRPGEEMVFRNMDHPGWPRHLDKIKMHWDEVRWNDARLLENHLRLPLKIIQSSSEVSGNEAGGSFNAFHLSQKPTSKFLNNTQIQRN